MSSLHFAHKSSILNQQPEPHNSPTNAVPSTKQPAALAPAEKSFRHATRIQNSITSSLERRALLWLAARIPPSINSDHLTLLGFVAMFLAGCSYAAARWHPAGLLLATLCLAVNWFGDSLDGTLARFRNLQRPRYGFYVDHMIDSFGALFLIAGLATSGYVDSRIAAAMLIAFLLLSIESYLASYTLGVFRLSLAKFGPTEIRILLSIANLILFFHPNATVPIPTLFTVPATRWLLLDFGGAIAVAAMSVMAIVAAIAHTITLYRQETHRLK